MPEIIVTIKKDGTTQVEVAGVIGPGCLELTAALEQALGSIESRQCSVEMYEQAYEQGEVRQKNG